jgi:hypothetical protein
MYAVWTAELINGSGARYAPRPRPWVARLNGLDERWGFKREFVKGVHDYSYARRTGSRGIYLYFALAPGFYEIYRAISWKHDERYFIQVDGQGNWRKVNKEEVVECLKNTVSE